ncbi:sensor histidine kinase [Apilactobacillus micheneri]|uniref:histidine kinase n=1 Tax=Apilactobacillus micheneri TaxID=1899430 RepID=A0ABY2Z0A8_9LACO|nr:HAMP domain-containing sensor histidine kinase [Apilactobacillus micheneri]TPR24468.1 sensor histidine kinase [Apilactobacillus micheneri]TPR25779.1 sensor histidine kinase [Apilactobacillus micheneri]TPR27969.1 sensor histidine kinase [Apilactobacillus micheneri]TPR29460.1 sensor histidine kinase [Apilactobacillus micheneri]TPR30246.1 sensor histidine kinase [Apilactobacillus micheneri]
MKEKVLEHKQQLKFFIKELIGFAILFASLGFIVYFFFQHSIYSNIDAGLYSQKHHIERNVNQGPLSVQPSNRPTPFNPDKNAAFQTNIIVFNKDGKILNKNMLGQRSYTLLNKITLSKHNINETQDVNLNARDFTTHFRSLLIKVDKYNDNPDYAGNYVLILQNIDADLLALHSFIEALIITLIFFWIIAILIAYYLSKSSMKPVMKAWHKQKEFSANAAHELRTPLTVIQNQMEFLLTKPNDKIIDQIQPISTTLEESKHLKTLTQRLLTLARSDSNIIQSNKQNVELKPFFDQIVQPFFEITNSQQKVLLSDINVSGHGNLDGDLIKQLMVILMDNAIKYTPTGGSVNVKISNNHNNLKLLISDTGNGISDADKAHIFERFYRTDKSRNSKTGGNGLGLSIAQWIVNQHHGKISVRDNHPTGTVFIVNISL